MKDEDMNKIQQLLQQMFTDWLRQQAGEQNGKYEYRYCQRCEEKRGHHQFTTVLPVCDVCAETMPTKELRELSESLQ